MSFAPLNILSHEDEKLDFEQSIERAKANTLFLLEAKFLDDITVNISSVDGENSQQVQNTQPVAVAMAALPSQAEELNRGFHVEMNQELEAQKNSMISEAKKSQVSKDPKSFMDKIAIRKQKMKQAVNDNTDKYWNEFAKVGKDLSPTEQDAMLSAADKIQAFLGKLLSSVLDAVIKFGSMILRGLKQAYLWVKDKFLSVKKSVTNFFGGFFFATPQFVQDISTTLGAAEGLMVAAHQNTQKITNFHEMDAALVKAMGV